MEKPSVYSRELPEESYPLTIEAYHPETRQVVWTQTVDKPHPGKKGLVSIPPLREQLGHAVAIRITFGDGTVQEQVPILPN